MGSKPKAKDYEASAGEKASASVAMAEYKYFKEKYDPLLQKMRDESLNNRVKRRSEAEQTPILCKLLPPALWRSSL